VANGNAAAERRIPPASSHKTCDAIERNLSSVALDNYDHLPIPKKKQEVEKTVLCSRALIFVRVRVYAGERVRVSSRTNELAVNYPRIRVNVVYFKTGVT
jgi:hypothetical protein